MEEEPTDLPETSAHLQWYVLQTLSNCEARVQKTIAVQAKTRGVQQFLGRILFPVVNACSPNDGKKMRQCKLYPGYLFAELDLYDDRGDVRHALWQLIREIQGVSGFVGADRPVALKQADIDAILARMESAGDHPVEMRAKYEVGMPVKVTDGPFSGSSGEVESVDAAAGTLRVAVGLFGRKTPVDLGFWQVVREEV
jgi:transcriptional antiterminator NusG